ncbi:MAG: hypothetical protein RL338_1676 [Chloroflexota bacterium]
MAEPSAPVPRPARRGGPARDPSTPVQYKGADLDPERGPGLGCFYLQLVFLVVAIVLTPLSVSLAWPSEVSALLLFVTIGLTLFVGQTVIFLLRLVAADRRSRRRPLASATKTVGELEDEARAARDGGATTAGTPPTPAGPPDPPA